MRQDGGIAPLVRLLSSWDLKVQRAGAGALRTLAFKNDDNKRQIVDCGALPLLIQVRFVCMLVDGSYLRTALDRGVLLRRWLGTAWYDWHALVPLACWAQSATRLTAQQQRCAATSSGSCGSACR